MKTPRIEAVIKGIYQEASIRLKEEYAGRGTPQKATKRHQAKTGGDALV